MTIILIFFIGQYLFVSMTQLKRRDQVLQHSDLYIDLRKLVRSLFSYLITLNTVRKVMILKIRCKRYAQTYNEVIDSLVQEQLCRFLSHPDFNEYG